MTKPSPSGFSYLKIAAIGSGFLGLTLVWTVYNAFMPLLLERFISNRALIGAVMGLDNLLAVVLIPVIGAWSDRMRSPLGQRLPFIVVGMPLAALTFALLPLGLEALWLLLAIDVVFLLAMTLYRAPVIALMPDHTPEAKRSAANGVINLMGGVGAIVALFLLSPLYDRGASYPFVAGGLLLLASFAFLFTQVERKPPYTTPASGEEGAPLANLLRDLRVFAGREYRAAHLIMGAIFLYFLGYAGLEAQFTLYATSTLGVTGGQAGLLLGFLSLAFLIFALPSGFLGSRYGKGQMMLLGLGVLAGLFVAMSLAASLGVLRLLLVAAGAMWALVNVQAYPLVADLGGRDKIGFFTGIYYLFTMTSSLLAPALMGLLMEVAGASSLFVGAALAFAAGLVTLWAGLRLRGKLENA